MQTEGTRKIGASRQTVWDALHDREVLQKAIPACHTLTGSPAEGFDAELSHKIGPFPMSVNCRVVVADAVPGESLKLSAAGTNLLARGAGYDLDVTLADDGDHTVVRYRGEARVNGPLRRAAADMLDNAESKVARAFFDRLAGLIRKRERA